MNYSLYDITFVVCRKTHSGECAFLKKRCTVKLNLIDSVKADISILYALVEISWHQEHKYDSVVSISAFNWRTGETFKYSLENCNFWLNKNGFKLPWIRFYLIYIFMLEHTGVHKARPYYLLVVVDADPYNVWNMFFVGAGVLDSPHYINIFISISLIAIYLFRFPPLLFHKLYLQLPLFLFCVLLLRTVYFW